MLTVDNIRAAHQRIRPWIHHTPVLTCATFDAMCGAQLFFKCENFQKAGAFKARGAHNAVFSLSDEEASIGVATHSSGNHGASLSLAARSRGTTAIVVMPENAPQVKFDAVKNYGGEIVLCEPDATARETTLKKVLDETGRHLVHPYNDHRIIAGQGTCALELIEDVPDLDAVIAPVGGGGLLSGTAITTRSLIPGAKIYAAEPEQADDAFRSMQSGKIEPMNAPQTIADGLKTSLGSQTFPIIQRDVERVLLVSEEEIVNAMKLIWARMKIVVEPSGATVLAAVLKNSELFVGKRVGLVISGGNVDLARLPWASL